MLEFKFSIQGFCGKILDRETFKYLKKVLRPVMPGYITKKYTPFFGLIKL